MGKVIDFGGMLVERRDGPCEHLHIHLDTFNQIVTCATCQRELNPFWMLVKLSDRYDAARDALMALKPSACPQDGQSLRIREATPPPPEPPR